MSQAVTLSDQWEEPIDDERLEHCLVEGLQSSASEMTAGDWQDIRRAVRERLVKRMIVIDEEEV